MISNYDTQFIQYALSLAKKAESEGEVPVGAVIVYDNHIIAEGWNQPIQLHDPSAHAEIVALRKAAQHIQNYRLKQTTLYVTLEPCVMCVGAMIHARIERLVFGAADPKAGAVNSTFQLIGDRRHNHAIEWTGGVCADACSAVLKAFFKQKRL
ncbi:MAG: tRNA adenosine(34) deaminase TadA [Gammaproteobacteria bacterium CG_4_10_14_0_8_um_filter_38_16]|nr:MAG: tRNA adenosine(34) deaminase TadA [Gammaproteobacteria bacterium CG_4_10_14_0_8_um_filter_38_16]PJA03090.1 MAG: tRNA adenosine(34) deaminase TadA [Gammaproteobacteria bacterium CG_4_10_14_0_2_um_filter_38_22]PJB10290.1 MAG: tRNA adenosine(34) deaminase TadA [Gammaproteobacteria bacterium CG_4_9_14_3_um_filter_38_9]